MKLKGPLLLLCLVSGHVALADSYTFTAIVDPFASAYTTTVEGINNNGDVIGTYSDSMGYYGFVEYDGRYTTISDPLAPKDTYVTGINDQGDIVGEYLDNRGSTHGFLDVGGSFTTLDDSAGQLPHDVFTYTNPTGLNNADTVVGNTQFSSFVESGGNYTSVEIPIRTGLSVKPVDINNGGAVVGYYVDPTNNLYKTYGFLDSNGASTKLDDPLGYDATRAYSINDNNDIFGTYTAHEFNNEVTHGFLYENGTYTTVDDRVDPGETYLTGINNAGVIVGVNDDRSVLSAYYSFIATPVPDLDVPEPMSFALFGGGFICLAPFTRRRSPAPTLV